MSGMAAAGANAPSIRIQMSGKPLNGTQIQANIKIETHIINPH